MKVSRLQINDKILYLSASYDLLFEGNWIDNVLKKKCCRLKESFVYRNKSGSLVALGHLRIFALFKWKRIKFLFQL